MVHRFNTTLLALLTVAMATSCSYEDVDVKEIKSVKINRFDGQGIELIAILLVENPNSYKVRVVNTDADLFLNGKHAGKAKLLDKVVVPSRFYDTVEARVRADFDNGSLSLLPMLLNAAITKKMEIRAKGTLKARTFVVGASFPFDETHKANF